MTGGRYTVFDRPDDRPPFDFDVLQKYQHVAESELNEVSQTARGLVLETVRKANRMQADLNFPQQFGYTNIFGERGWKVANQEMQNAIVTTKPVARAIGQIRREHEEAAADIDWDNCHPRWHAAHLLLLGDLARVEANTIAYVSELEELGKMPEKTNYMEISSFPATRTEAAAAQAAEAAYTRCMEAHPGTPWAQLAEFEKDLIHGVATHASDTTPRGPPGPRVGPAPPLPSPPRL